VWERWGQRDASRQARQTRKSAFYAETFLFPYEKTVFVSKNDEIQDKPII
jgi:hypothetical protein